MGDNKNTKRETRDTKTGVRMCLNVLIWFANINTYKFLGLNCNSYKKKKKWLFLLGRRYLFPPDIQNIF